MRFIRRWLLSSLYYFSKKHVPDWKLPADSVMASRGTRTGKDPCFVVVTHRCRSCCQSAVHTSGGSRTLGPCPYRHTCAGSRHFRSCTLLRTSAHMWTQTRTLNTLGLEVTSYCGNWIHFENLFHESKTRRIVGLWKKSEFEELMRKRRFYS